MSTLTLAVVNEEFETTAEKVESLLEGTKIEYEILTEVGPEGHPEVRFIGSHGDLGEFLHTRYFLGDVMSASFFAENYIED